MTVTRRTYYKALFLTLVFGLNTAVSFACSFSNLFHHFHHHNNAAEEAHEHGEEKKHVHEHSGSHHDQPAPQNEKKDDCCSNSVVEMQKVEKAISRTIEVNDPVPVASRVAAHTELSPSTPKSKTVFPDYTRRRPPTTIQDLRIVIQSFQI